MKGIVALLQRELHERKNFPELSAHFRLVKRGVIAHYRLVADSLNAARASKPLFSVPGDLRHGQVVRTQVVEDRVVVGATIKALAKVCEAGTSALECSRNGMTKSASSLSLKLQVSAERCAQASAATYSDAGCCAAAVPEKPATPENRNPPTETNHRSTA